MFQTFFNFVDIAHKQFKYSEYRIVMTIFYITFALFLCPLIGSFFVSGNANLLFHTFSFVLGGCSIFLFFGIVLYAYYYENLSFKQIYSYILKPKQIIPLKFLQDNFDELYNIFSINNELPIFESFYNLTKNNTLEKKDVDYLFSKITKSSFKTHTSNEYIENENNQDFSFFVKKSQKQKNGKDLNFFE